MAQSLDSVNISLLQVKKPFTESLFIGNGMSAFSTSLTWEWTTLELLEEVEEDFCAGKNVFFAEPKKNKDTYR